MSGNEDMDRRQMVKLAGAGIFAVLPLAGMQAQGTQAVADAKPYGLIGQMLAKPGWRDTLVSILREGTGAMPGCMSYIVALDADNADAIWITEVWTGKAAHAASLNLPAVRAAIQKARPIIAGFGHRFETVPVAGI